MILVAVASILIAALGVGILIGYSWGRDVGVDEERARVDRWHATHSPRSIP